MDFLYSQSIRFSTDNRLVVHGNAIDISIKSLPERGKANAELIKRLARHFKVKAANIRIVYGLASRKKLVEISWNFGFGAWTLVVIPRCGRFAHR